MNPLRTVAQQDLRPIGERTKAALDHKANEGERRGRIPFGFRIDENMDQVVEVAEQLESKRGTKRERHRGRSFRVIAGGVRAWRARFGNF